jgi:hypothetical protein
MSSYLNDFDLSRPSNRNTLIPEGDESHFCVDTPSANRSLASFEESSRGKRTSTKPNPPTALKSNVVLLDAGRPFSKVAMVNYTKNVPSNNGTRV